MTAETKLQELYEANRLCGACGRVTYKDRDTVHVTYNGEVFIAAVHIDLIANLVKERMEIRDFNYYGRYDKDGNVTLSQEDMEKIANLVVERLKNVQTTELG